MSITSSMFMYSLTLRPPGMITQSITGNFIASRPREQQVITIQGERILLNTIEKKDGKWTTVLSHHAFGILRCISALRIAGAPSDLVLVSSDSGRVAVLSYNEQKNTFERVHLETFGKSGVRRTVPGQYLATDPRGRCCMFASVEKNKVVYILNRNQEQQVTISSPQDVNLPQSITFALCAVDNGFQNPTFAALEVSYSHSEQDPTDFSYDARVKELAYYRVDLGLNHVVRDWKTPVDHTSNLLLQVPGGEHAPSGVLVCALGSISYYAPNHEQLIIPIPRRKAAWENPLRKRRIICGTLHRLKQHKYFHMLQTDDGDVFKLTMKRETDGDDARGEPKFTGAVTNLELQYFGTFPPATDLCLLKVGLIFVAAENGDSHIYKLSGLGDEEPILCDSRDYTDMIFPQEDDLPAVTFRPHDFEEGDLVQTVQSLNPQRRAMVDYAEAHDDEWKIYTTAGTSKSSTFNVVKHGLAVNEHALTELGSTPQNIFTVQADRFTVNHKYIALAFSNMTVMLEIQGNDTTTATNHGLNAEVSTIHMSLMGDYGILQVWNKGFRYHTRREGKQPPDWTCPPHRTILKATSNHQQLCLALSSGELLYFEVSQDLSEMQEYNQGDEPVVVSGVIQAMSMGDVPEGRVRAPFLVIGSDDSTIRVLSLDPGGDMLASQSIQSLSAVSRSIEILDMEDTTGMTTFVHVGLYSGVYLRAVLDDVSGELGDVRSRFLGPDPVELAPVEVASRPAILACGSRTFLSYPHPDTNEFYVTPLDYKRFHAAKKFNKGDNPGIVGLTGPNVAVFSIPDISSNTLTSSIALEHTPRDFCRHPDHPFVFTVQSDSNTFPLQMVNKMIEDEAETMKNDTAPLDPREETRWPRADNYWSSCIQVIDPRARPDEKAVLQTVELQNNEAALCCAMVPFESQDERVFFLVGTGRNMPLVQHPNQPVPDGLVHVYEISESGNEVTHLHSTIFKHPIRTLLAFQGKVAFGVGDELVIYDIGIKQLLRRTRCKTLGSMIVDLKTQGSRIIVADIQSSVTYVVFKATENKLIPFADDSVNRWCTATAILDYDTVAGGDKFGNFWVVRCPKDASDESDEPGSSSFLLNEKSYLSGTPHRLAMQVHNFVQDIPISIQKTTLVPGGQEIIFWAGLQGTLGIFVPFVDREDVEFFVSLEGHLRADDSPLAGRDHLMYRSYYVPVKGCVDGDLCERFMVLDQGRKMRIAAELDRTVREVEKKIGEMRTRVAF